MSSPPPIRTKLLRILLLPLVSMIALWGFIAYSSVDEIASISQTQDRWEAIGSPVLELIIELQQERQLSAAAPRSTASYAPLAEQRPITDSKAERLREVIGSVDVGSDGETPAEVQALVQALDSLQSLRASADDGGLSPRLKVIDAYNDLIDVANQQFNDRDALSGVSSYRAVRGMAAYSATSEYLGREHAVLTNTIVHHKMTPTDRASFVAAFTSRRIFFANAERDAGPALRANLDRLVASAPYKRLLAVEDRLFVWDTNGSPPVEPAEWKSDAESLLSVINRDTHTELGRASIESEDLKSGAYWRIGLVLVLGLLAVVGSVALSFRFGRSLISELKRLQSSAVELAEERLPRLVERLRRGDDVDPATEAPGLDPAHTAEVDRVVNAFSAVRRTAVEAAVGQATLRKGVAQVFLNLAWRNQALLHRQLALLDTMERRIEEPEVLEDLFKLDHLTTRMRRHAENLIILSDSAPARRWRDPVPLFDVVRAAVLEVEDYTRVTIAPMPNSPLLVGAAVTDVIHLIAELVENAAVFSPPDTTVHIRSMTAANGFALEVEDRGLGLNQATLDELNARLADPPEFDLADSDRLGLFVVSRLAVRHSIKISLRRSPYDGTTAIVLLPSALLALSDAPAVTTTTHTAERTTGRAGRPMRALGTAPADGRPRVVSVAPEPFPSVTPDPFPSVAPDPFPSFPSEAFPSLEPEPFSARGPEAANGREFPGDDGDADSPGDIPDWPAPESEPERVAWFEAAPTPRQTPLTGTGPMTGPANGHVSDSANEPGNGSVAEPRTGPATRRVPGASLPAGPSVEWSVTVPAQEADEDLDGLPMRVPQANMAPQLRAARRADRSSVSVRSPEELSQLMSSMQRGWQQGRSQTEQGQDVWNRKDDHPDARPEK
ncbi:ATP-binding protein [Nonomuraea sp. NEAU-A123]|uniref:sensor histidine kinase n=1 Tax=Nonomuraea sp. NEAU-A123 TaxID=2839649 RepID=UPI001BE4B424|nr:ATP-binding protein [Nonomuraea sp. NEAU-A123]MBT2231495.1 nitrate- and nitrite sensing domain-containing protein [Nonomuraea sp. NEAU-A123]